MHNRSTRVANGKPLDNIRKRKLLNTGCSLGEKGGGIYAPLLLDVMIENGPTVNSSVVYIFWLERPRYLIGSGARIGSVDYVSRCTLVPS
jgi:hypothetical protein